MRVLVVDDEKLLVKGIKFNLEMDGMEVDYSIVLLIVMTQLLN